MHQTLQRVELLNLNNIIQPANKNIALDFLANAMPIPSQGYWYRSMIRGKRVSFWEDRLNQFMGIAAPKECAVERPIGGTVNRGTIIQAIMVDEPVNFGRLISEDIKKITRETGSRFSLGHCALINALCELEGVERMYGDIDEPVKGVLTYDLFARQPEGPLPTGQQQPLGPAEEQPQAMEEEAQLFQPTPPHFNTYTFAMANFAEDFAGMMLADVP
ncbi:hypothetical protein TSUD_57060 [Trifolium subterraneum]|uniref:Uncharacterized protein n=1 Tax=Trifolium subterraneum TaxID=3900 RepID=A0A2Z6N1L3_TRISU|nr:hypothetical protein TSUD_57060 [Trifolium subterraneum]